MTAPTAASAVGNAPWTHREPGWSAATAARSESLLALANGSLGLRGTLDEGAPAATPGTYLAGFHESVPIAYADRGAGDPRADQVMIGVSDGTRIRLVVEGDPLDVRTGTVLEHERALDLRTGLLERTLRWRSPAGHEIRLRTRRLVSLEHAELAAISYEVEADDALRIEVHSELGGGPPGARDFDDPRAGVGLPAGVLVPRLAEADGARALLVHRTQASRLAVAAGMDHVVETAAPYTASIAAQEGRARWSVSTTIAPGQALRLVKLLAYHWAPDDDDAGLASLCGCSLDRGRALGFAALAVVQRAALDHVWAHADVELEGDPELQHALRYSLFQLHQNTACAAGRAIPAKGLTGAGYGGHTFWDTEIFLLPALAACAPRHVEAALRWRASTLPEAQAKARRLGLRGAAFAWRTISGAECSGYLPAGTAAFHVNADIAHAVTCYVATTGDARFEREAGAPLLVETARLWASLGHHDPRRGGRFCIDGVTGPDEYSVLVDNNLYTNLMAQANLRAAVDVVARLGAGALGVEPDEPAAWRRAADTMTIPYDAELGVHLQDEQFARHAPFDFAGTPPEHYPLLLHVAYWQLYRSQVVKQPDLVLAMALHPERFSAAQKRRNLAFYEAVTVRDSSLSAGTLAVVAAAVGHVELAYDYLAEAALLDHHDTAHNTADGLHLAALAGAWTAVVAGLGGTREHEGRLSFAPRLPAALVRIAFGYAFRGRLLRVEIGPEEASYELRDGAALSLEHWSAPLRLEPGERAVRAIPAASTVPDIRQPAGREPRRRRPQPAPHGR